jgi:hypothetical protein
MVFLTSNFGSQLNTEPYRIYSLSAIDNCLFFFSIQGNQKKDVLVMIAYDNTRFSMEFMSPYYYSGTRHSAFPLNLEL